MAEVTKGPIGEEDVNRWDGSTTYTFTRTNSTGGTSTLRKFGYVVDALKLGGGGANYTGAAITAALVAIGTTNKCTLVLRPGTWTISANTSWASYTNVTFKVVAGALISHGTYTLNVPNLVAGDYQVFSGTGAVTLSGSVTSVNGLWFGMKADNGTTDNYSPLQRALNATPVGRECFVPPNASFYKYSTGTPVLADGKTLRGGGWGLIGGGGLYGTVLMQTGTGRDGFLVQKSGASAQGWWIKDIIIGTDTDGLHGIKVYDASRGGMDNVLIGGCGTTGSALQLTGTGDCNLNTFRSVKISASNGVLAGFGLPANGFDLDGNSGPNVFVDCGVSGVTSGTGYGWLLAGTLGNTFINPEAQGCKYAFFFSGAAGNNVFISPYFEASVTADVGGATSNPSNLQIGIQSTSMVLFGATSAVGASIYNHTVGSVVNTAKSAFINDATIAAFTGENEPIASVHAYRDGADVLTADTWSDMPMAAQNQTNTADVTVMGLKNATANADGRVKVGFGGGVTKIQCRKISNGAVAKFSINPSGGSAAIGGLAEYADNAAALAGGLVAGDLYRTATGVVMVTYAV
jgi:hypothetical protein